MKPETVVSPEYGLFIDGAWRQPDAGEVFSNMCPADGTLLCTCAEAGEKEVDAAVEAARRALPEWSRISPPDRAKILNNVADAIDAASEKIAKVETLDIGRTIPDSEMQVRETVDQFRYFASAIRTTEGEAKMLDDDTLRIILSEPLGVVGAVVPWNSPLMVAAWKIAPALAAGNTVVIKPSSLAPVSLLELARLVQDILPKGVFNVITGRGSTTGTFLIEHPGVNKLSFTGSTEVGLTVAAAAAAKVIPTTLELGGKSANIVFPDCDREKAIEGTKIAILANAGEVCCSGSRVLVHQDIYADFLAECVKAFDEMRVGLPWDEDAQMGTLIDENQLNRVLEYVEIGKKEGARVACGGYRVTDGPLAKGAFVRPTILADVDNSMRVAQEEIFGPVACFIPFRDEDEAIRLANDSDYGLGGGVWTKDLDRAFRVARAVQTGTMWVNTFLEVPSGSPFGGYKKSGYGREVHTTALQHFSQKKNIYVRLS